MRTTIPAKPVSFLLLIAATCFLFGSCKKVEVDLGTDFVDNNITNLVLTDSSTVEISTVYVDSFITSGAGSMLVGNYKDPAFGNIASRSFVQLGTPGITTLPNGAVFDSLEVILTLNKTFYGDTTKPYTIAVHQLTEAIKLPTEQYSFYNTSSTPYNATPLGSTRLLMRPGTMDTLSIPISKAVGQDLFNKMFNADALLSTTDLFVDYFKGLAIVDGGGNDLIMGFKDTMTMRLHYRNPGVITTDAHIDFAINNNANQYNNISADRTGTPLAPLGPTHRELLSSQTENAGFSQYISGAMAKIRFPFLRNLTELNDFVKLIKAELVIKPVQNSFTGFNTLPPSLRLSQTDQYNLVGVDLAAYSSATGTTATEYGNLSIDNLYGTETSYTYDITTYLQAQILNTDLNKNGLLLLPPDLSQAFNRVVIGDKFNKGSQSEVKIYYATVK